MSEIPERFLTQAYEDKVDDLVHDMKLGENSEWLWQEIERILASKDPADCASIDKLTLADLIERVCEQAAERMLDNGDLDEAAMDAAVGFAEDRYDRDMDR